MGQKVSPHGLRVGVNKDWSSSWIADKKDIAKFLLEDQNIRKHVVKKYNQCRHADKQQPQCACCNFYKFTQFHIHSDIYTHNTIKHFFEFFK